MRTAACAGLPTELFFVDDDTEKGGAALRKIRTAKAICATCPVTTECLEMALATNSDHGVFGGTTPRERMTLSARKPGGQRKAAA